MNRLEFSMTVETICRGALTAVDKNLETRTPDNDPFFVFKDVGMDGIHAVIKMKLRRIEVLGTLFPSRKFLNEMLSELHDVIGYAAIEGATIADQLKNLNSEEEKGPGGL